ncbi:MAG: ABC transporter permease [Pleomorphochaeta sp.]
MNKLKNFLPALLSIIFAFAVGALILLLSHFNPIESYISLFNGAFGSAYGISETLVKMIPILTIALGTSVAFRAQLWNIGGNGQYTLGCIATVVVCVYMPGPTWLKLVMAFILSIIVGMIFGGLLGLAKAKLNANEVITTLMFDYIIALFLSYLVYGPLMDPDGHNFPQSKLIAKDVLFTKLMRGTRIHTGLFLALILVVLLYFFWKSKEGFRIKMIGANPNVAKLSGISVNLQIMLTMGISCAFAAIAGYIDVLGIHGRLQDNIAGSLGSVAIVVALLGDLNPIGIVFSAFFFSALTVGGQCMQRYIGVPYSLVTIIQALVIVFVVASKIIVENRREK